MTPVLREVFLFKDLRLFKSLNHTLKQTKSCPLQLFTLSVKVERTFYSSLTILWNFWLLFSASLPCSALGRIRKVSSLLCRQAGERPAAAGAAFTTNNVWTTKHVPAVLTQYWFVICCVYMLYMIALSLYNLTSIVVLLVWNFTNGNSLPAQCLERRGSWFTIWAHFFANSFYLGVLR